MNIKKELAAETRGHLQEVAALLDELHAKAATRHCLDVHVEARVLIREMSDKAGKLAAEFENKGA